MLTPMKIAPATAAQTPAAWVRRVAVIAKARFLSLLGWSPDGCSTVSRRLGTGVVLAHHHMM
jgi:hypothetical protein